MECSNFYISDIRTGKTECRCLYCGRCGEHTGNSHQGHYWGYCKVTKSIREAHFCCPGDCELDNA
jgi:hypothetical protein